MTRFRICLLGKFCVLRDEDPVRGLDARKVQELLAYLLLYRDRAHTREALAATFWPDCSSDQARKYLRQSLWQLQAALAPRDEPPLHALLRLEPEWIDFNPHVDLWLDVALLEQTFLSVQGLSGQELDPARVPLLEQAVQLYAGELLEGCTLHWCLYERERLQRFCLSLLDKLMAYFQGRGEYETALYYGTRILRQDRCSERTHRRMMELYYQAGDRSAALQQYQRCVSTLKEDLSTKPGRQTEALYQQIWRDELELPGRGMAAVAGGAGAERRVMPETLGQLEACRAILAELQRQVQQQILSAERVLKGQR
jgi:DNA-binding SARP family transcriptional activator